MKDQETQTQIMLVPLLFALLMGMAGSAFGESTPLDDPKQVQEQTLDQEAQDQEVQDQEVQDPIMVFEHDMELLMEAIAGNDDEPPLDSKEALSRVRDLTVRLALLVSDEDIDIDSFNKLIARYDILLALEEDLKEEVGPSTPQVEDLQSMAPVESQLDEALGVADGEGAMGADGPEGLGAALAGIYDGYILDPELSVVLGPDGEPLFEELPEVLGSGSGSASGIGVPAPVPPPPPAPLATVWPSKPKVMTVAQAQAAHAWADKLPAFFGHAVHAVLPTLPTDANVDQAIRTGRAKLLTMQRRDGSWDVQSDLMKKWNNPQVRSGITALTLQALARTEDRKKKPDASLGSYFSMFRESWQQLAARSYVLRTIQVDRDTLEKTEAFGGNNEASYALSTGLDMLLDMHQRQGPARQEVTAGLIRTTIRKINSSRLAYMVDDRGASIFQAGMAADALQRAEDAGFKTERISHGAVAHLGHNNAAINSELTAMAGPTSAEKAASLVRPYLGMFGDIILGPKPKDPAPAPAPAPEESSKLVLAPGSNMDPAMLEGLNPAAIAFLRQTGDILPAPGTEAVKPKPRPTDTLNGILTAIERSGVQPDPTSPHREYPYMIGSLVSPDGFPGDGAARNPLSELVLYNAGRMKTADGEPDYDRLEAAAQNFLDWRPLIAKKRGVPFIGSPHDFKTGYASYYLYYGTYHTARVLQELPPERAKPLARELMFRVLNEQRPDGTWLDSVEATGPSYGTSMAMMSLEILQDIMEQPAAKKKPVLVARRP